jgi:outer membrane receptor protein involved in Fe transport
VAPDRSSAALGTAQHTPADGEGALATWTATHGAHAWLVGVDARRVAGTATDTLSPPMVGDETLVARSAGGEQYEGGVFAQDVWSVTDTLDLAAALRLDTWHARAGARLARFGDGSEMTARFADRDELQLDPRLGALYHATDAVALRASVYRSFRAPTLNELYRPFQVGTILTEANPDLRPETLWGAEAGPQIVAGTMVFRATGFYNRLDDAVANVTLAEPLPSGAMRQRQNLGRSRVAGVELDLSWRPTASWIFLAAHTFTDARVVAAPAQPALVGKRLAQDPRDRTVASATFDDARWLTATAQLRHLGRQFEDDLETLPMEAVTLVDARVDRSLVHGVAVFASVQNLFDRRYLVGRAGVDTEGAPRMFELGLTYR